MYAFRRRAFAAKGKRWHDVPAGVTDGVLARLAAEGPLTSTELGGARKGGPWWDWSGVKIAVEWLLDLGEVVCVRRTGLAPGLRPARRGCCPRTCSRPTCSTTASASAAWSRRPGAALGVATARRPGGLPAAEPGTGRRRAARHRAGARGRRGLVGPGLGATPTRWPAWGSAAGTARRCSPRSTRWSGTAPARAGSSASRHALEAYKPAAQREHGYFAMPLLVRRAPARPGRSEARRRRARRADGVAGLPRRRRARWPPPCARPRAGSVPPTSASNASHRRSSPARWARRSPGSRPLGGAVITRGGGYRQNRARAVQEEVDLRRPRGGRLRHDHRPGSSRPGGRRSGTPERAEGHGRARPRRRRDRHADSGSSP